MGMNGPLLLTIEVQVNFAKLNSKYTTSLSIFVSMTFTAAIPNAANNPYIKQTKLPEGTLFIIVGSILLGLFVIVLVFRLYYLWATHKAATYNESKFTALEPITGGPFIDPVENYVESDEEVENGKEHPTGVPLRNFKTRGKPRPKSQFEKIEEARNQGKFFSPTAEVLNQGTANKNNRNSVRFSITQTGRNSSMILNSMSNDDLSNPYEIPQGAYQGQRMRPVSMLSLGQPMAMGPMGGTDSVGSLTSEVPSGPYEGSSDQPSEQSAPMGPYDGGDYAPSGPYGGDDMLSPPTGSAPPSVTGLDSPQGPYGMDSGVPQGPYEGEPSGPYNPPSGESINGNEPGAQIPLNKPRTKKLRPPSTYLDELMN